MVEVVEVVVVVVVILVVVVVGVPHSPSTRIRLQRRLSHQAEEREGLLL